MGRNKADVPVRVLLSCDTRHSAVAANAVLQRCSIWPNISHVGVVSYHSGPMGTKGRD
jgi:hypothetical protein